MPDNNKNINDRLNRLSNSFAKDVLQNNINPANTFIGNAAPDYGESQFDTEAPIPTVEAGELNDFRGERQSRLDKLANAVPRLLSKVSTEIAKTPGYLYALGESGLTDKTLAESLDNAWLNGLEQADQSIKDQFAIYKPKSVRDGNIWDNLTSTSFWTDEGVDGAGFLLSMLAPGAALKATGIAGKLAKLPMLSKLGQANIELGQATLLNTALESAAETKGVADNLREQFKTKIGKEINPATGSLWTEEEAKDAIGNAAVSTFQMNMGILLVPNMIMNKNLLGRFGNSKTILDEFRDATGRFVTTNPIVRKSLIKQYAKAIGVAAISEGFVEEAGQTTIENYNEKVALNQTNQGVLEGLANEYIETLGSTEGQKSILLGAVLGSLGGIYGTRRRNKYENQQRSTLSNLINSNFEGFSTSMDDLLEKDENGVVLDENGKPKINFQKTANVIANLVMEQQSTNLQDLEALNNNKDMYDYIFNQQLSRFALPYLNIEGGIDILNQHIDDLSKDITTANSSNIEDTQYRNQVKEQVKNLKSVYDSIREDILNLPLEQLSNNTDLVGSFANKLLGTAYQESSKQLFINNKLQELEKEVLLLHNKSDDVSQFAIENEKLLNRIQSLRKSLEISKENYKSIFDIEQQKDAFNKFSDLLSEQEDTIREEEEVQNSSVETQNTQDNIEDTPTEINNEQDLSSLVGDQNNIEGTQSLDDLVGNQVSNEDISDLEKRAEELMNKGVQNSRERRNELISQGKTTDEASDITEQEWLSTKDGQEFSLLKNKINSLKGINSNENTNSTIDLRSLDDFNDNGLSKPAFDILDQIDFDNQQSIDKGISKILEIINSKFIPKDKEDQVLSTKAKLIGNNDYRTYDYLEKYITLSTKDFTGLDVNKILNGTISSTITTDFVSEALNTNNADITRTANEQITQNPREITEGLYSNIAKGISKMANVVMMKLFNNYFSNGTFRFERDENGLPLLDNNSNIDIPELNRIQEGDIITFELIELTREALDNYNKSRDESIKHINHNITNMGNLFNYPTNDKTYGFDNKHIAIKSNGLLIGFVQQPHAISNDIEDSSKQDYINARNTIIEQRKAIIDGLSKGSVTSVVKKKGAGNLYTKLKSDGKIDLVNDLFSNPRSKDITPSKNLIFVYNDGTKLDLPKMDDSNMESEIKSRLLELGNWGTKGSVYQLVQDTTGKWYPIPVYANLIDNNSVKGIIKAIKTLSNSSKSNDIINALNPYIYSTSDSERNAPIKINENNGTLTIDGRSYTIDDLNRGIGLADFKKSLLTKRQNISILNINSKYTQRDIKSRNTLSSNALLYKGEYLVQPFLSFESIIPSEELTTYESLDKEDITVETINDNNETKSLLDRMLEERQDEEDNDPGFSRNEFSDLAANRTELKAWLNKNLPGLTLSEVDDLTKLKTNITDAFGAYRNMVIYLFNNATNKTGYHEAFHGVFRNLLSNNEKFDLLQEAIQKYNAPSRTELDRLQEGLSFKATNAQLTTLYYEEKLADDFADYTNNIIEEKSLLGKIKDFFNKIISFFDIFTLNNQSKIDQLFESINKGELANKSTVSKKNNLELINRELRGENFDNFAFARSEVFNATVKWDRTKSIGDSFMNIYSTLKAQGETKIKSEVIFKYIYNKYLDISKDEKALTLMTKSELKNLKSILDPTNFNFLRSEVVKYLEIYGLKVNNDEINFEETDLNEDNIADNEITSLASQTTKGLGEWVTQSGLKSASVRLKMFLSSIPVTVDGVVQNDVYGFAKFHDFNKLYYFLERSLTGINTFEEMIDELKSLSEVRPEINNVIDKLTKPDTFTNQEELTKLQNDFKSNFSKQQLSYTLVKFDTDSSTGAVTYRIFDANRMSVNNTIIQEWKSNLTNNTRNTISETRNDEIIINGTKEAIAIKEQYQVLSKQFLEGKADYNTLNRLLIKAGIEFSPDVLTNLISNKSKIFDYNVKQVLDYYANTNPTSKDIEVYDKAFRSLVNLETSGVLLSYTQSFNNVENSAIYTIQLPSFASKLIDDLSNPNINKFDARLTNLERDPLYQYSNLLNDLKSDNNYRVSQFRMNYLDGLKDEKGNKDGSKFTNMSPKDFMSMQIALFQNLSNNANKKGQTSNISKYIYITPSDKSMAMIFDAKSYNSTLTNGEITLNTPIVNNFYNVLLQEASRIKQQLIIKDNILSNRLDSNGQPLNTVKDLLDHYHYKPKSDKLAFDGFAYQIMHFGEGFNNKFNQLIVDNLFKSDDIEEALSGIERQLKLEIVEQLKKDYHNTLNEAVTKGVIAEKSKGEYVSISIDSKSSNDIKQSIADFALNTWLNNIEMSNLLNGDVALYKVKDLQKRTYQSGAMGVNINIENHSIAKTKVIKDFNSKSDLEHLREFAGDIVDNYNKNNVTDAQVLVSPQFYRDIMIGRGTWSNEMQIAYDIAEGIIENPTPEQLTSARLKLSNIKPFYFGNRFDEKLGIQRFEQVKCAMLPLFNSYIKNNPLLASKRIEMNNDGLDMIAFESSFKAAIGYRTEITSDESPILELDMNNFMIQVDNPAHIIDEENDSIRQIKMLILGNIDPNKTYNGKKGLDLVSEINNLEGFNLSESLNHLVNLINGKKSGEFKEYMKEMLTKRNATDNIMEALNIIGDEFEYALDNGSSSTAIENLIASLFTNKVIKQAFEGGSGVQASAIGMKYKGGNTELDALQSDLKYFVSEDGNTMWSEAIMPAWSKKFFNKDGTHREDIPEELKQLLFYRIPTEGFHSMMPIKVKAFLPEEYGNTILMPYEVTTQFGADFDFDKIYFLAPEFVEKDGKLEKVKYDESKSIEDNSRSARNNKILDNYLHVISSKEILPLILNPSGFDYLAEIKANIDKLDNIQSSQGSFFSSVTQRDYKQRNHVGIGLKGQLALHVSGHSYATLLNLTTQNFEFNGISENNLSKQYSFDGKLISKEVSALMAAILDDIKNPIIQALGVNEFTADVWATIVRSGFDSKTAVNFVTQPSIVELSQKLAENNYKIKAKDTKRHSVNTLMVEYHDRMNEIFKELSEEEKTQIYELNYYDDISDENMEYFRHWKALNKNKLFLNADKRNPNHNFELVKYYKYQFAILNRYMNYDKTAKDLVKINRLFGVNKEVGPNFEDIVNKKYLLAEIEDSGFSIEGLNRDTLSTIKPLEEAYKAQIATLDYLSKYFPYDSPVYNAIKFNLINSNLKKDGAEEAISKLSVSTRMLINSFIRNYIDYKSSAFEDLNSQENKSILFNTVPKLLATIKNSESDSMFFNGALRKNIFIENLQVSYDEKSKLHYISMKGNRLDIQLKNNISEQIESLFRNPNTKTLIEQLVKYSFAATGFHRGLKSFHDLIPPVIFKELGYADYRKSVTNSLNLNNYELNEIEADRIVNQMIRNFPNEFTKAFDLSTFNKQGNNLKVSFDLAENSGRAEELMTNYQLVKEKKDYPRYIKYLRVYDNNAKKSILYQFDGNELYKPISKLGKAGYLIEINSLQDINQSINIENNLDNKEINSTFVEEDNSNETIEKPILDSESYEDPNIQDISDLFGEVQDPTDDDINNLPDSIKPC